MAILLSDVSLFLYLVLDNVFSISLFSHLLKEMLDIMKSIYDMMGKYTYPTMQDDAPIEHVESFFQVKRFSCDLSLCDSWKPHN